MLFLATAFRQHAAKSRYAIVNYAALPTNYAHLLHASAPTLRRKGAPSIYLDFAEDRRRSEPQNALGTMIRRIQNSGMMEHQRARRVYEKGAVRRVREQKERVMRGVKRDFRTQLQWCLKQRMQYVGLYSVDVCCQVVAAQVQVIIARSAVCCWLLGPALQSAFPNRLSCCPCHRSAR